MQISIGEGELNGAAFVCQFSTRAIVEHMKLFEREYMKMFCRLTKFAFSNWAHSPPHLSNISIRSSLFWRENPQQNRKDRRCCYPSNRLFSSYSPLYDWKKDSFSSLARWKEPSWLHRQTPLGISNPNWIAHRRHMRAPFFLQTTAHQFKRGGGGPYTIFSLLCGRELIVIICKSNSPAKEKREKRTDSDWCSRVDPPWMGAFAVIIGR